MCCSPMVPVAPSTLTRLFSSFALRRTRGMPIYYHRRSLHSPDQRPSHQINNARPGFKGSYSHRDKSRPDRGKHETIQPVEHTAVPGDQPARILHAKYPLDERFPKIAALRDDSEKQR